MKIIEKVKELRERTGCGIVDCKEALEEAKGDLEKAITVLRKKGIVKADKKSDRDTNEGVVASYVHSNNKVAVMVSLLCETDFVARTEKFQTLAHDIALHIAAADPLVVHPEDIDEEAIAAERVVAQAQAKEANKPQEIQQKIVEGKLNSYKAERALLTQPFVKEPSKKVEDLIAEAVNELGENISIGEFSRIQI